MNFDLNIILYIIFGVLPSLIWLFYFLKKDIHPEPNYMIIKVFLWGCLITIPVLFIQLGFTKIINIFSSEDIGRLIIRPISDLSSQNFWIVGAYWFLVIGFSEELFKYLVVRLRVVGRPELDEPLDAMLYLIIAALGFTAIENIFYILAPVGKFTFDVLISRTLQLSFIRFVGGTFLHALCSGIVGYMLAISLCKTKNKWLYTFIGLLMATVLHGLFDFSIMGLEGDMKIIIPITILITLAVLTSIGFEKLKGLKGLCSIKNLYGKQIKT